MGCLREVPWKPAYGPGDDPLHSFYIPALARACRYDRLAGFFSSTALAVAAQGVAHLVAGGGRMRLLVCARLSPEDSAAIRTGVALGERLAERFASTLADPEALRDRLVRSRLEVLAWLAAAGRLTVRVVIPCDPITRRPLVDDGLFHAKGGIIWDGDGDGLAFSGSINETATAWLRNYERFHCFPSWTEPAHFQAEAAAFERLWTGAESGWLVLDLPEAVQQQLIRLAPPEPPVVEPLDRLSDRTACWLAAFLRDAPRLDPEGWRVGIETARLAPFPHQRRVAATLVAAAVRAGRPIRRLLADEVGLGKTVEAALILRSLLLGGHVRRALLLTPRALVRQWQETLDADFLVAAVFYDGASYHHPDGRREPAPADPVQAWSRYPVVITSAQLVRRQERAEGLLAAEGWDLVIVDEAHHARRRDFADLSRFRPNRFLQLLQALATRCRHLLLLTATPMQLHPVEVYDLLSLLGLPNDWADQERFLAFFTELAKPPAEIDLAFVAGMIRAAVKAWGWEADFEAQARAALGARWPRLRFRITEGFRLEKLTPEEEVWLLKAARAHNPVRRLIFRHTRQLLRRYRQEGRIRENVPERRPQPCWLQMSTEEWALYHALEDYITTYYRTHAPGRPAVGWMLTVYRQRLASSLYALRRSLERRRAALQAGETGLTDEDLDLLDLEEDDLEALRRLPLTEELAVIDRLLETIRMLPAETKLQRLMEDLGRLLGTYGQVIVFTQYADTMDFLRETLRPALGARIACYSGRGGEVWNPETGRWVGVERDQVQRRFLAGEFRVLLCTEAGGEGLNLQSCGAVINYDLPWNPMRLEQRVGRVDRIGQTHRVITVLHYLYEGTVEGRVYQVLGERLDWFRQVVGPLQPVLHRAEAIIREAALTRREEREARLQTELTALERELGAAQQATSAQPWLEDLPAEDHEASGRPPVSLAGLARVLSNYPPWKEQLEWQDATTFVAGGETWVARQGVEPSGRFFSYGSPLLTALLALPEPAAETGLWRHETERGVVYEALEADGRVVRIHTLEELEQWLTPSA